MNTAKETPDTICYKITPDNARKLLDIVQELHVERETYFAKKTFWQKIFPNNRLAKQKQIVRKLKVKELIECIDAFVIADDNFEIEIKLVDTVREALNVNTWNFKADDHTLILAVNFLLIRLLNVMRVVCEDSKKQYQ